MCIVTIIVRTKPAYVVKNNVYVMHDVNSYFVDDTHRQGGSRFSQQMAMAYSITQGVCGSPSQLTIELCL